MLSDPRTVIVGDQPAMLRGRLVKALPPTWPAKDPGDTVDLAADVTALLGSATILQVDPEVSGDPAVEVASCQAQLGIVSLRLLGGTDGLTSIVLLTLTLSDGRRLTRAVNLPVVSQGFRAAPDPNMLTVNGMAISVGGVTIATNRPALAAGGNAVSVGDNTIDTGG